MSRKRHFAIFFFGLFVTCFAAYASPQKVTIALNNLVQQKTTDTLERLYFAVVEYPTEGEGKLTRVPSYPEHWLSTELPVKNVQLWQGTIDDANSVSIVFTLMTQTLQLLLDDWLIGSIQVEIANNNGKISTKWGQPNFVDQPRVDQIGAKPLYVLYGDYSQYGLELNIKTQNTKSKY